MMLYIYRYTCFLSGMDLVNSPLHFCWDWVWSSIGPKPPWQTAPGKVPQEACGRVDEQQVYTFSPCFTSKNYSKKVHDKTDIFTSRWEETHLYMIDLVWVCLSCLTETTSRDFYSSEVRKTLEKTENPFFQQSFWKALLRSPLLWSLPVLLGLWTCLGKDGFFCSLTAKRRCQQNWGERKWFCSWEWMVEDLSLSLSLYILPLILYEILTDDSQV